MTQNNGIPWKQAEVSLRRFNDMAIPHHMGLLKNHRVNIEKSLAVGDWNRVKKEEINAMRVIKQVKNLLVEMDTLREKVREQDLAKFDAMIDVGKQKAFDGMREYMEIQLKAPATKLPTRSAADDDEDTQNSPDPSEPVQIGSTMAYQRTLPKIETNFQAEEHMLAQRQTCLKELENLQHEIRDLHGIFHHVHGMVHEQSEQVQSIADNAEEALENVQAGEHSLRRALTYKKAMYPVMGALLGTCVGGPIGLVAGLKAGGLAAVGCGILGFTGGSVLKANPTVLQGNLDEEQLSNENDNTTTNGDGGSGDKENLEMHNRHE